jgi:hypothetical protein
LAKRFQRRRFFWKSTNQKQELSVAAIFVNGSGRNEQSLQRTFHRCFLPSFGSFCQTVSEEKNLKNQSIRNKNRLWLPCLLTDRDERSYRYRGPSIDASYQVRQKLTLPSARWAKNGQYREAGNIGYTRRWEKKTYCKYVLENTILKQTQIT